MGFPTEVNVADAEPGDLAILQRCRRDSGDDVAPYDRWPPASIARATRRSRVATSGSARSRGLACSGDPGERPTVRLRARTRAGFRTSRPSRTASSITRTSAVTDFLTVDRLCNCAHSPIARSTRPALIIPTGTCPSVGRTRHLSLSFDEDTEPLWAGQSARVGGHSVVKGLRTPTRRKTQPLLGTARSGACLPEANMAAAVSPVVGPWR